MTIELTQLISRLANDLGFTEVTVAALLGHSHKTITARYIHSADTALVMAADTVSGLIDALLRDAKVARTHYALDRCSRRAAMDRWLAPANNSAAPAPALRELALEAARCKHSQN